MAEAGATADGEAVAAVLAEGEVVEETAAEPIKPEPLTPEILAIHLKSATAFQVFDHEKTNTVDVRELGAIIRSLGLFPTEAELNDMTMECEDEEESGVIKYSKFEPMITRVLQSKRFQCETEEVLLKAFQTLDEDDKGFLTEAELSKALTQEGEPFTEEEMEEMLAQAKEVDEDKVDYDEHVTLLHIPP